VINARNGGAPIPSAGQLLVGTSDTLITVEGKFYPEKLQTGMLSSTQAVSTVEINQVLSHADREFAPAVGKNCPEGFRFALKATAITHIQRLRNCESTLKRFLEVASVLPMATTSDDPRATPAHVQVGSSLLEDFLALRRLRSILHLKWSRVLVHRGNVRVLRQNETALCLSETTNKRLRGAHYRLHLRPPAS